MASSPRQWKISGNPGCAYGDHDDTYIDHLIQRAPSFHSVAKLAAAPKGMGRNSNQVVQTPGRAIRDLPPRLISRLANVDNAFNLFGLLPPGALVRQAQDPLIRRGNPSGADRVRSNDTRQALPEGTH